MNRFFTVRQLCARWDVSRWTIARMCARGELHKIKIGPRRVVIRATDVTAMERAK